MSSETKVFTFQEVVDHNKKHDCWLVISGKVYDVTSFLDDHPGGDDVMINATGKDATDDFEDVGHSNDAREEMKKYCIGEVETSTLPVKQKYNAGTATSTANQQGSGGLSIKVIQFVVPLLILALAYSLRNYLKKE
ncbi:oxidoreductase [Lithospermum erythrorhizon]|uniref:Oxidoreductase n=1 Tax=Lithospermum erythrorhizon TaxID=34254 RepID=A0AAV3RIL9_LITER